MSVTSGAKRKEGGIAETGRVIFHALIIALVIRTFLFQPFNIPSGSMKATLLVGDYLFVSKYSYGYSHFSLPFSPPHPNCKNSWGTYRMFMTDEKYEIKTPTSQYFAAQLLTKEWVEPKDAEHQLFRAVGDIKDSSGHVLVTAYAVLRPDGLSGQGLAVATDAPGFRPGGCSLSAGYRHRPLRRPPEEPPIHGQPKTR